MVRCLALPFSLERPSSFFSMELNDELSKSKSGCPQLFEGWGYVCLQAIEFLHEMTDGETPLPYCGEWWIRSLANIPGFH
ncbi:MAG: hypothetical protein JWP89_2871 [Schlesneria sp.]|nr:hypothetical protein [Schlesneria sp.]